MSEKGKTSGKVRLNIDLSPEVAKTLVEMSKQEGITLSEAVRRSIKEASFLQKKRKSNVKFLIEEGGILKEVVFIR